MNIAQHICQELSELAPELEQYLRCAGRQSKNNNYLGDLGHSPDFSRRAERFLRINPIGDLADNPPTAHQRLRRPQLEDNILKRVQALFDLIENTHPLLKGSIFDMVLRLSNTGKVQADFQIDGLIVDRQDQPRLLSSLEKRLTTFFDVVAQAEEPMSFVLEEPFTIWHLSDIDALVSAPRAEIAFLKAYAILWPQNFLAEPEPSVSFGHISPFILQEDTEFAAEKWRKKILSKGTCL